MERLEERVYCFTCKHKTIHNIVYTHKEESGYEQDFAWKAEYHIVQCAGCERTAFVKQYGDEDMWEFVYGEKVWQDTFTVYPQEPPKESELDSFEKRLNLNKKAFPNTPKILLDLYNQIIDSYNMRHNVLCASGLRTLIEGICNEVGVKKGHIYHNDGTIKLDEKTNKEIYTDNLAGRIFGLYEGKFILLAQALILNKIKTIGNKAVHSVVSPDTLTLREVIQIMEQIIHSIYELKEHKLLRD